MASAAALSEPVVPPTDFLSSDEFLEWLEPGLHADLIAGEIFMHSPVSFKHANLLNFVDRLLAAYIAERRLGQLYREVVAVKLSSRHTFLPDLCFFTNEQLTRLQPNYAPFAPALVAEVLSPSTQSLDRRQKFAAYEEFGVAEYWILDPMQGAHQFYCRQGEVLAPHGADSTDKMVSLVIPGFYLRRQWLNQPEFPDVMASLQEIRAASAGEQRPARTGD
jgi:Uma2 family endonuclease